MIQPICSWRQAELRHHAFGRDADALALQVARNGEAEDQDEDRGADARASSSRQLTRWLAAAADA